MIVRNVNGIVKVIAEVLVADQDSFIEKNKTGGFFIISDLPFCRYGNYKMEGENVVVDTEKETVAAAVQYKHDRSYPSIGDQLDALFHAGVFPDDMTASIQAAKDAHPKP